MIEAVFWYETTVSNVAQAEDRYQRILEDMRPVPLTGLDQALRAFVLRVRDEAPQARILDLGSAGGERLYSRHGVVVAVPEELVKPLYSQVSGIGTELNLSVYDREDGYVLGLEHDPNIVFDE